jgi:iron complex outermembrane recepter protein
MGNGNFRTRASWLACAVAMISGAQAQADQAAPPADTSGEIVVTATRQAQPLSKVALSVAAFDEKALDRRGIKGMDDIALRTPGLTLTPNGFGSQADISIRGIDSQVGSATTGIYVDDTPIQTRVVGYSSTNVYPLVFDLDRVEVLRGPQGTLFGSGAEGGAVRFITPEPSLDKVSAYGRAEVSATKGGDASGEVGIAFGAPIIPGKLGFRASIWTQHMGGYIDHKDLDPELDGTGAVDRADNYSDAVVGRVALAWAPGPNVKITPSVLFQDRKIHDISTFWEGAESQDNGHLVNGQPLEQPDHDRFVLPAIKTQIDLPGVNLIANLSYLDRVENGIDDYSTLIPAIFTPPENFVAGDTGYSSYAQMRNVQTAWTGEVRAQSSAHDARFTWVAGLFLSAAQQKSYESIVDPKFGEVLGGPPEDVLGLPLIDGRYSLVANSQGLDRQAALFGEVNYKPTPALKLTAGLRVARSTFIGSSYGSGPFLGDTIATPRSSTTETPVTPKFAVSYQADRDTMVYASASKGYRIGGTNSALSDFCNIAGQGYSSVPASYRSDSLWSYEVGAKSKLFDRHLEVAASAYHVDWSNIQQLVYVSNCGQQFVDNLGHAKSNGFDLQLTLRPVEGLTIDGAVGYTSATYTATIPYLVQQGDHIDTQPWSGTVGVTYEHALSAALTGYARVDYTYHSQSAITPVLDKANGGFDPAALPAPETQLVNLRAGTRVGQFDISAFVNNLFNSRPLLTRYSEVIGNSVHRDFTFRPLTAGLTGTFRY